MIEQSTARLEKMLNAVSKLSSMDKAPDKAPEPATICINNDSIKAATKSTTLLFSDTGLDGLSVVVDAGQLSKVIKDSETVSLGQIGEDPNSRDLEVTNNNSGIKYRLPTSDVRTYPMQESRLDSLYAKFSAPTLSVPGDEIVSAAVGVLDGLNPPDVQANYMKSLIVTCHILEDSDRTMLCFVTGFSPEQVHKSAAKAITYTVAKDGLDDVTFFIERQHVELLTHLIKCGYKPNHMKISNDQWVFVEFEGLDVFFPIKGDESVQYFEAGLQRLQHIIDAFYDEDGKLWNAVVTSQSYVIPEKLHIVAKELSTVLSGKDLSEVDVTFRGNTLSLNTPIEASLGGSTSIPLNSDLDDSLRVNASLLHKTGDCTHFYLMRNEQNADEVNAILFFVPSEEIYLTEFRQVNTRATTSELQAAEQMSASMLDDLLDS